MKKEYEEPEMDVIRYNTEDVILTSSHHHCGTGILTDHFYDDTTGDTYCDTDDDYHCGGGSGDFVCDIHEEGCEGDCSEFTSSGDGGGT